MPRRLRRAAVVAGPLAVVLVAAGAYAVTRDEGSPDVTTGVVGRADVREVVEAPGSVVAKATATVSSPADGTVLRLRVRDGQQVTAGQVLLRIDSPEAEARLDQARRADAEAADAAVVDVPSGGLGEQQRQADAAAERGFAQARAAANAIPDVTARARALAAVATAEGQYAAASNAAADAARRVDAGLGGLARALSSLASAQRVQTRAAVEVAEQTVEALVVRAPIGGTVTLAPAGGGGGGDQLAGALDSLPAQLQGQASELLGGAAGASSGGGSAAGAGAITEGAPVSAGTSLLTVTDASTVSLVAEVDETDILLVRRGVRASVELDAVQDATYSAAVSSVESAPAASTGGGVTYRVRLRLLEGKLADGSDAPQPRPGMSAVVDLAVRTVRDALAVPVAAVFRDGDQDTVWVERTGRAEKRRVTLGAQAEDMVQVTAGLKGGETVVVRGADRVRDGQGLG
ncbi:efflux RND transporter periplasmic adaptor subunit [Motilibacter deserti]|uniref:Efflux RND transporter periplasmic adaptor subunit n=1 Tax=Motilibacter deserti TaxID=2714956 RepID=A0ABX0GZ61_9ACTN|nr:efflux RND transporter periplasmic adaptor subunit [Motilibacter deserti]